MGCLLSKKGNIDLHDGNESQVNHDDVRVQIDRRESKETLGKNYRDNIGHDETLGKEEGTLGKEEGTLGKEERTLGKDEDNNDKNAHVQRTDEVTDSIPPSQPSETLPQQNTDLLPLPQPHRKFRNEVIPDVKAAFSRVDSHADQAPDTAFNNCEALAFYLTHPNVTEPVRIERANVEYHDS